MDLRYNSGYGNHFETEAVSGALPIGRNSPQRPPRGLYPEQLTGTAFTAPRVQNQRSWLYRILPSVVQGKFEKISHPTFSSGPFDQFDPNHMRWQPLPLPSQKVDFLGGLVTYAGNGSPASHAGCAIHLYACNQSMVGFFYNSDGDMMFVPQEGKLLLKTEMGHIELAPTEMAVIPRGVKFQVVLLEGQARGYVCENFGPHFVIPDLGPIGANGLANPRDFLAPVAAFEEKKGPFELVAKFMGGLWKCQIPHSPLDVVAWHGNYHPYKYDLKRFNAMNTVTFDHPDPSIFTVMTSPSGLPGVANIDFVIFPARWMVAEDTFRPPYYHRNIMSEFMGLIQGVYDAKSDEFAPGGASLHNTMTSHGPDAGTFEAATKAELKPERYKDTLAFMFETRLPYAVTDWALKSPLLDKTYLNCWQSLKPHFK